MVFVTEFFDETEVVQAQIKSASIEFVYAVDKRTCVTISYIFRATDDILV